MKGTNILILNPATVMAAVQEYFAKRMVGPAPKVVSVERDGASFRVIMESETK